MKRTNWTTRVLALPLLALAGLGAGCKDSNTTITFDAAASESRGDVTSAAETGGGDAANDHGGGQSDALADSGATPDDAADATTATDAATTDGEQGQ